MNDTYLQLLEYLEPWGIDREVEVGYLLYEWFTHQISVDPLEPYDSVNGRIERFLDVIHDNKHIMHEKQKIRVEGQPDTWRVQARLTFLGLQYLNEHRVRESNINLNAILEINTQQQTALDKTIADNSIIQATNSGIQADASRRQTRIFIATAIIASLALGISGFNAWTDFHKDRLSQEVSKKDTLIHKLEISLFRLKIDSSRKLEAKKTLPKKN